MVNKIINPKQLAKEVNKKRRKRLPNPSIEYFKDKIEHEKEKEKVCREVCINVYGINPDMLVSKLMPQAFSASDRVAIAYVIPEKQYQIPAWMLFKETVDIIWHHIRLNGAAYK